MRSSTIKTQTTNNLQNCHHDVVPYMMSMSMKSLWPKRMHAYHLFAYLLGFCVAALKHDKLELSTSENCIDHIILSVDGNTSWRPIIIYYYAYIIGMHRPLPSDPDSRPHTANEEARQKVRTRERNRCVATVDDTKHTTWTQLLDPTILFWYDECAPSDWPRIVPTGSSFIRAQCTFGERVRHRTDLITMMRS